jgi:hypothetical protein
MLTQFCIESQGGRPGTLKDRPMRDRLRAATTSDHQYSSGPGVFPGQQSAITHGANLRSTDA